MASAPVMAVGRAIHGRSPHRKGFARTPLHHWSGGRARRTPPGRPPRSRRRGRRGPGRRWRCPPASTSSTAAMMARPMSRRPRPCVNIIETERIIAIGFASPWPAMSGAEPCTGSKMPGGSLPSDAEGPARARRRPPPPGRRGCRRTGSRSGSRRSAPAGWPGSSRTSRPARGSARSSAYSAACSSVTTRRHSLEVASTFALSTETTRPSRRRASLNAHRATRSTWARV